MLIFNLRLHILSSVKWPLSYKHTLLNMELFDKIGCNILKIIAKEVSPCITLIINQTLSSNIFPSKQKTAKVIPIYKKNDKTLLKNYRPISILPVVSKIIENVMHNQMMDYFTSNELFSSQQDGFNRSTELAALELMDRNIDSMNQKISLVNIYADLSKAFHCLDHAILLFKLKYYNSVTTLSSC